MIHKWVAWIQSGDRNACGIRAIIYLLIALAPIAGEPSWSRFALFAIGSIGFVINVAAAFKRRA